MSYMDGFYKGVEQVGVVPVVVLDRAEDAVPLGKALAEGGLPAAEVTFRTAAAADSISAIAKECPDVLVGAGTVLNEAQAKRAVDAGARFVVSPGYDMGVVRWCLSHQVPVIPAGVTPTEVIALVNEGIEVTKFFPAAQYGGLSTIRFMPTGGVNAENLNDYLADPAIIACGGTWMCKPAMIHAGEFDRICELSREAAAIVRG